jgi:hypothetical protein
MTKQSSDYAKLGLLRGPPGAHSLLATSAQDHSLPEREVVGDTPANGPPSLTGHAISSAGLCSTGNLRIMDA